MCVSRHRHMGRNRCGVQGSGMRVYRNGMSVGGSRVGCDRRDVSVGRNGVGHGQCVCRVVASRRSVTRHTGMTRHGMHRNRRVCGVQGRYPRVTAAKVKCMGNKER